MEYWVADKRTGFMVEKHDSYHEASEAVDKLTSKEWEKGDRSFMFEIVNEDHKPIVTYVAGIHTSDGKTKRIPFAQIEGYTAEQYKLDHGLNCKVDIWRENIYVE